MEISRLVNCKVCPSIIAKQMRPSEPAGNLQVSAADAGAGNVAIEQQATQRTITGKSRFELIQIDTLARLLGGLAARDRRTQRKLLSQVCFRELPVQRFAA